MNDIHDIAIIGGGASATLLAWTLRARHQRSCVVIDPSDRPALGLAYGTDSIDHLLNVPARGMSAIADEPDHFLRWLREKIDPNIAADSFIPRALYGLYLQTLFQKAAPTRVKARVISCLPNDTGAVLTLDDGRTLRACQIVLALGHFAPPVLPAIDAEVAGSKHYHHQVWAKETLHSIDPTDPVMLIGSGLTAIDMIMQLRSTGHTGQITLVSRHGQLPQRHAPAPCASSPLIEPGASPPTCTAYLRQFKAALKQGLPWRSGIDSLRTVTNRLWADLPQNERARFRRHLQKRWDVARHRMAPQIAEALDSELARGTVRLRAGHLGDITAVGSRVRATFRHRDQVDTIDIAHVLNCTGPNLRYDRVASPLLQDLFARGFARPGQGGAGLDTTKEGRLIGREGDSTAPIFTLGPARQGTLFESIAIPEIREQAYDLARTLDTVLTAKVRNRLMECCA